MVDSGWFSPAEVMASARHGAFPMAPPTWWTLFELTRHPTLDDVLGAATRRPVAPIQPVMTFDADGIHLLLPGHPDHPEDLVDGMPDRVEFEAGAWVAYLDGQRIELPR